MWAVELQCTAIKGSTGEWACCTLHVLCDICDTYRGVFVLYSIFYVHTTVLDVVATQRGAAICAVLVKSRYFLVGRISWKRNKRKLGYVQSNAPARLRARIEHRR